MCVCMARLNLQLPHQLKFHSLEELVGGEFHVHGSLVEFVPLRGVHLVPRVAGAIGRHYALVGRAVLGVEPAESEESDREKSASRHYYQILVRQT